MSRAPIPPTVIDSVLIASRRRCCICFGLNRDTGQKVGQIAHLDRDSANPSLDNLAYLCLNHHDLYDSRTSQSKGFTIGEVKQFRAELRNAVEELTQKSVSFGNVTLERRDPYAGHYVRTGSDVSWSAEIDVSAVTDSPWGEIRYFVSGFAIFGGHRPQGPNMGDLAFVAPLQDGVLRYTFFVGDERDREPHSITVRFGEKGLTLEETNEVGRYGINVSFNGDYGRADKIDYSEWYWHNPEARELFHSDVTFPIAAGPTDPMN